MRGRQDGGKSCVRLADPLENRAMAPDGLRAWEIT